MGVTILFLGANPSATTRLALDKEAREIEQRMRIAAEHRDAFRFEQVWGVEPSDLQERILRHKPDIIHFSGHGNPAGQILLEDGSGKAVPVHPAVLAELFEILSEHVRCVVLNACYSEAQAKAIVAHVDCVVGMSPAVKDTSAIAFAGAFYQALAFGKDVQTAVKLGRNRMKYVTDSAGSGRDLSPEDAGQGAEGQSAEPLLLVREGLEASTLRLFEPPRLPTHSVHQPPVEREAVREPTDPLVEAQARRDELQKAGASTAEIDREILELRRTQREGKPLRAGNALGDGRYLLQQRIGSGGFGVVWHARDRQLNVDVAIKVLHANLAGDPVRLERFLRGARYMAELEHDAVVRVREPQGKDGDTHYYVMEYVPGGDLRKAVLEQRLPVKRAIPVILRVAEALAAAHARGMVHRDVKPANILLDENGEPKLTDFDLVGAADTTGGTRTGALGTWLYASPEQLQRPQEADARADVYALGMTAVFCLRKAELSLDVMRKSEEVLKALPCSEAVREVLRKAISWEPEERFANARAFGEALREAERESEVETQQREAPVPQRKEGASRAGRRWWVGVVSGVFLLGAGGLLGAGSLLSFVNAGGGLPAPLGAGTASTIASTIRVMFATVAAAGKGSCPVEMVLIPGGTFRMGSDSGNEDEKPPHDVTVGSFCLDQTEVTVAAYTACVREKACKPAWTTVNWAGMNKADRERWDQFCNGERAERGEHPINCVDWEQADTFCKTYGKRLPTEPEWEYAARGGSEQRTYPWGEEAPAPELLNACGSECVDRGKAIGITWKSLFPGNDHWPETAPVKSYFKGRSRWGVYDLAGNVWEWTSSFYCPYSVDKEEECTNSLRVIRGGSWVRDEPERVRASVRLSDVPSGRNIGTGFRCARGPEQ